MTLLIDQIVEQRIAKAIENGEFDDLPKQGEPLILDDDNGVPEHLRMGYRILKNAGYLPPELVARKEVLELCDLVAQSDPESQETQHALAHIRKLELKMQIKGIDTRFLHRYLAQQQEQKAQTKNKQ